MFADMIASALILFVASLVGLAFVLPKGKVEGRRIASDVLLAPAVGFVLMLLTTVVLVQIQAFTTLNLVVTLVSMSIGGIVIYLTSAAADSQESASMPVWSWALLTVGAGLFLAATANTVYFIYQVADFGEYVNSANELLAGQGFGRWFVNGFPALLAVGGSLVGEARAISIMPAIAVAFALAVAYVPWHLRMQPLVGVLVFTIALAHPLVVWYGRFPASETAYAMVLVLCIGLWLKYVHSGRHRYLLVVALGGVSMSLIRGNAAILVPVLVGVAFVVLASGAGAPTERRRSQRATIWLIGGIMLGLTYDIAMNRPYVVDYQFAIFTPSSIERILFDTSTPQYALLLMGGLFVAALLLTAARNIGGSRHNRWIVWASAFGVLLVAAIPIIRGFLVDAIPLPYGHLLVIGSVLIVVAVGGSVVSLRSPLASIERTHTALLAWVLFGAFIAFQSARLTSPHHVNAPWFLYWQRYYLSEILPVALLLTAFFFDSLIDRFDAPTGARPSTRSTGQIVIVALTFAIVASSLTGTVTAASTPMFEDAREELDNVALAAEETMELAGTDRIYWFARSDEPLLSFWPNTHRPIALPLLESFNVLALIGDSRVDELAPTAPDAELGCQGLVELTSTASVAIAIAANRSVTPEDIDIDCDASIKVLPTTTATVTIERTGWVASVPVDRQPVTVDTVVVSYFVVSRDQ